MSLSISSAPYSVSPIAPVTAISPVTPEPDKTMPNPPETEGGNADSKYMPSGAKPEPVYIYGNPPVAPADEPTDVAAEPVKTENDAETVTSGASARPGPARMVADAWADVQASGGSSAASVVRRVDVGTASADAWNLNSPTMAVESPVDQTYVAANAAYAMISDVTGNPPAATTLLKVA